MDDAPLYRLSGHACRQCLGRIVEAAGSFRCAICEATSSGTVEDLCSCGIRIAGTRALAGFRCIANPRRSAANPAAIIVAFGAPDQPPDTEVAA